MSSLPTGSGGADFGVTESCVSPSEGGTSLLSSIGLKYWAICFLVASSETLISHITRKNAIIAVMKSAKAIFQAPPWCPSSISPERRTMMIGWS